MGLKHIHHWKVAPVNGTPFAKGECRCGQHKTFRASYEYDAQKPGRVGRKKDLTWPR